MQRPITGPYLTAAAGFKFSAVSMVLGVRDIHGPMGYLSKKVINLEGTAKSQSLPEKGINLFGKRLQLMW